MKVLTVKFRKPSTAAQETSKLASQTAPQMSQEYHKYTICSALFSSISRLLTHSQMIICNKVSCKHCETIFESKNQLHEHLRNECQNSTSQRKSKASHKSSLSSLIIAESTTSSAECATSSPPLVLSEYRAVLSSSLTYETTSKNYLIVTNLYMRYISLKSVKFTWITCFRIVLLILTVKNLYKKFHERQIEFSAIKSTCDSVKSRTWCFSATSDHFRRALRLHFSSWQKTNTRRLDIQQQHHMTATFFASSRDMIYNYRRRHCRRPEACCWWRRRPRWIWSHEEDCVKIIWYRFKI